MDESISRSIERACELARNLEASLPNLSSDNLVRCIDEIVDTLGVAKQRMLSPPAGDEALKQEIMTEQNQGVGSASSFQEWVSRSSTHSATRFIQMQQLLASTNTTPSGPAGAPQFQIAETAGTEGEASFSRRRKRKDEPEKMTLTMPAPVFGNTEMPPEDGFTWRKYGQKEILGSNYPRSYYRCTHQKLYLCPAKKQVQRLDDRPNMFAVTYRGTHTCHMSSTAPSSLVPPQILPLDISHSQDIPQTATSSHLSPPSTGWLSSVQVSLLGGGLDPPGVDQGGAGPSTTRFGADYPVADMADAMFNSGSSSGNSMESLFAPADEDKKS